MQTNLKQKTKTNNRGFSAKSSKICLSFLVLISLGLSSSFWYTSPSFFNQEEPEPAQKKDISEFWKRLSERLQGVFGEVLVLVNKWKTDSKLNPDLGVFLDTDSHDYKYFIDSLAKSNIIQWAGNQKFYPDNYMRVWDFIKILVNSYRYKVWYDLDTTNWLNETVYIQYSKNAKLQTYINTAYSLWFLNNISTGAITDYNFDKFLTTREISKIFDNINNQYPGLISRVLLDISDLYTKRGECSKYITQAFQIGQDKDIQTTDYLAENNSNQEKSLIKGITEVIKNYYLQG